MIARLASRHEVRIVGVEMSFGDMFKLFVKAMHAYLLAMFVWMVLIGVAVGILVGVFGLGLLGIIG